MNELERAGLIASFHTALIDCFRDEDNRQLYACVPVDIEHISANDTILCMLYAFKMAVAQLTGFDGDPLEFLALLTRLLFLDNIKNDNCESEGNDDEIDGGNDNE